jgi:hypothetical protein
VYAGATLGGTGICQRPVTVAGGTALIDGTYTKVITVASGGTLGGTGTVAASNLTLNAGAMLRVTILDPSGTTDALNVTGLLNVTNTILQVVNTNLLTHGQVYRVVTCESHTNAFAGSNLPPEWVVDYRFEDRIMIRSTRNPGMMIKLQ